MGKIISYITQFLPNILNFIKNKATCMTPDSKQQVGEVETIPSSEKSAHKPKKIGRRDRRWHYWIPFVFFWGNGKFQPLYFFVTIFCVLASGMLAVKIYGAWRDIKLGSFNPNMISTGDLATVLGFISSLILLYNSNKKNIS